MTLRHRLLLVYLIVVLLSVATVGAAVFEVKHARQIISEQQLWHEIVLIVQELKSAFPSQATVPQEPEDEFLRKLARARSNLAVASVYVDIDVDMGVDQVPEVFRTLAMDVDLVQEAFRTLDKEYRKWRDTNSNARPGQTEIVKKTINNTTRAVNHEVTKLDKEVGRQNVRTQIFLIVVFCLTLLHVAVIGSLLRRWLLWPMEKLNRQVDALARDEPPAEPLLTNPLEMANLAKALDRARRSLGTLRQQLIDAERLTTIGQFAAQLAHNLRYNPLASIRATAQLTARHTPDNSQICDQMKEIIVSVDRLNHWIAGLMEVARREPTPTTSSDIVPVLRQVRDALASELAAKDLTLTINAPQQGLACAHDAATLEHALIAMIVNAIEASPLGETIELRAEHIEIETDTVCRISVTDNGAGLPPDDPEQIFEFSYSTKQRGMGLGLALARQALQRQGGYAHAENNPVGGATLYVILPIKPPDAKITDENGTLPGKDGRVPENAEDGTEN